VWGATPASFEGLLLRDPLGNWIAVGPLLALQPPRSAGSEPRVELSSAPLELKANTRCEVLNRIGICDGSPIRSVCLEAEYAALGAFETGIVFDHKPPSISSLDDADGSPLACGWGFSVVGADDLAPPSALRFLVAEQAWLGPSLSLVGHRDRTLFNSRPVQMVPVDPSGNRGAAMTHHRSRIHLLPSSFLVSSPLAIPRTVAASRLTSPAGVRGVSSVDARVVRQVRGSGGVRGRADQSHRSGRACWLRQSDARPDRRHRHRHQRRR
jgi:hypothetical protein